MKKFFASIAALVLSVWLVGFSSSRGPNREPATDKLPCVKQIEAQLTQWGITGKWEKKLVTGSDIPVFVSPTQVIGEWVEVDRSNLQKGAVARRIAFERNVTILWPPETCVPQMTAKDNRINPRAIRGTFTDAYLRQLANDYPKGLVYAWSPHMPYSGPGIENIRKAAAKLNVPVFFVLDPKADDRGITQAKKDWNLSETDLKKMESIELFYRGLLNHFPGAIAFKDRKMIQQAYLGLKTESEYVTHFKNLFGG